MTDEKSKIRDFVIKSLLNGQHVADDEDLLLSGLVDSLGVFELVAFLEASFDLSVPMGDVVIENFGTIDAVAGFVQSKQA
jgi:acyl carrier protein